MRILEVEKFINKMNEEIEKEIQKTLPNNMVIPWHMLYSLDSFVRLRYTAGIAGLLFPVNKDDYESDLIMNGVIHFTVPAKSEIGFIKDGVETPLAGVDMAKLVKNELVYIITHFCIRCVDPDQVELNILFRFKERNVELATEAYDAGMSSMESMISVLRSKSTLQSIKPEMRESALNALNQMNIMSCYGIFFNMNGMRPSEYVKNIYELHDINITVPEYSEYTYGNGVEGEIAGENAYKFALAILSSIGMVNGNTLHYTIRRGEKWTKKNYADASQKINTFMDLIR